MGAAVLHTRICKLFELAFVPASFRQTRFHRVHVTYIQGTQLGIWILVADALFEGAHSILGRDCLGSDYVGYFEIESDVLPIKAVG